MKATYKTIAAAALAATALLCSCDDDFARPPIVAPVSPWAGTENTTIAQFKQMYWQDNNSYATAVAETNADGQEIVIKARVISSDLQSCLYQYLYVEDETGAMTIAAKQLSSSSKLGTQYGLGQEVYIKPGGLYAGRYAGLFQIGALGTDGASTTFVPNDQLLAHVSANGLGNPEKIQYATVTIPECTNALASAATTMALQARAVRFENVHFTNPGTAFIAVSGQDASIPFADADGNSLIIRMNRYCTFGNSLVPKGTGTIIGEMGYFNGTWQVVINSQDDLQGFEWSEEPGGDTPDTPDTPVEAVASVEQTFDASTDIPAGWKAVKVKGDKAWYIATFDGNNYASMTGYKGTAPFDSWLIAPPVDLAKAEAKVVSFSNQVNGYGSTTSTFKVFAMDSADPTKAKMTELTPALATAPASGYSGWTESGELDLSALSGVVYIGFQYAATRDANYATWCVDNVYIGKKAPEKPVVPVDPVEPDVPTPPATPGDGVTFTGAQIAGCVTAATTVDGYTFTASKGSGATAPAPNVYNDVTTIRLYADNTLTIAGASKIAKIVFTINTSTNGKRYTTFTPNVGAVGKQAAEDANITWTGDNDSVTFTVGKLGDFGTENTKPGQIHIMDVTVYPAK